MRKLERMIRQALAEFSNWRLADKQSGSQHYVVTDGRRKITVSCSPKEPGIAVKNLRQDIRRVESGVWS